MTNKGEQWRKSLIRKAKTIQNQVIHMPADDYKIMLLDRYGKDSTANLTINELIDLTAHLNELSGQSQKSIPDAQARKIWVLWRELHKIGEVRDPSERALNKYVERQTKRGNTPGVRSYRWLNRYQASAVIESLKKWQMRIERKKTAV